MAASSANAADIMIDPTPERFGWTGAYVGIDLGGAWHDGSSDTLTSTAAHAFDDFDDVLGSDGSLLGGIHAGYDMQFGSFVVGGLLEAAIVDLDETFDDGANDVLVESSIDYLASAKLRLGYAFNRLLVYGTAGASMTSYHINAIDRVADDEGSLSETMFGYNVGLGMEYAATQHIALKLDYAFHDFASEEFEFNSVNSFFEDEEVDLKMHTLKVGLSYRF